MGVGCEKPVSISRVALTQTKIYNLAQNPPASLESVTDLIPTDFSNEELWKLAKSLKMGDWDVDTYGDRGITVIEHAFYHCLYALSEKPEGAKYLMMLREDPELSWDAHHSEILSDALAKCGNHV